MSNWEDREIDRTAGHEAVDCPLCHASGQLHDARCPLCMGDGWAYASDVAMMRDELDDELGHDKDDCAWELDGCPLCAPMDDGYQEAAE